MRLVRGAWRILVGVKDALVLFLLLLFFGALFAALTARQGATAIRDGALLLDLDGAIVEQPEEVAPLAALSGERAGKEYRLRDVVRAIDAGAADARVKAIVVDLDRFGGGFPAAVGEVADALRRARAKKPVLAYATAYTDAGYRLAASAGEVWVDPLGGALFRGPGGSQPYFKGLIDRLGVNAHIYRVGTYKAAVEPLIRADQSPESAEAMRALAGSLLGQWRENVARARPKAQLAPFLTDPVRTTLAANGDLAAANLRAGLVDRVGDRLAFSRRVAQIVGAGDASAGAAGFAAIRYDDWLAANPLPSPGEIGVVTVAGNIIDGRAGPGTAGGDTIARYVLDGLRRHDLKALVVRIDSLGGSVTASETIRLAIMEAKRRGLPVVASMGGSAASGGYWVATAGDAIFAEPTTLTGSIGIFAVLPTFENALAKIGVTSDGVRTTPLSGQPDLLGGTTPEVDAVLQSGVEKGYRDFLVRVAQARRMTPQQVDRIAQGRVWDGGTARQLGLVDRFGTLDDAVAEAARRAKLDPATARVRWLEKKPGWGAELAKRFAGDDDGQSTDVVARLGQERRAALARALGEAKALLLGGGGVQARCLECGALGPVRARAGDARLLDVLLARFGL